MNKEQIMNEERVKDEDEFGTFYKIKLLYINAILPKYFVEKMR